MMADKNDYYVQFGCGACAPSGWLNFDASPWLRVRRIFILGRLASTFGTQFPSNVRFGDIVRGLPIPDGSVAGLYGSHILEHLALNEFRLAVRNCHRLLRSGGILRVVVPDMQYLVRRYLEQATSDWHSLHALMQDSWLGESERPRGLWKRFKLDVLGNSRHRWMWDEQSLAGELGEAGFVSIRRCAFGDCEDPRFQDVEDPLRFDYAVAMECRKR